jgi:hypothetical protein
MNTWAKNFANQFQMQCLGETPDDPVDVVVKEEKTVKRKRVRKAVEPAQQMFEPPPVVAAEIAEIAEVVAAAASPERLVVAASAPVTLETLRAARATLHAECKAIATVTNWTHESVEGERFVMTPEQAREDLRLFCSAYLASDGDEAMLIARPESVKARMQRIDAKLSEFLASPQVQRVDKARVSHAEFSLAFKRFAGLQGVSQHAISQACRRASLQLRCSHVTRFWLDLQLA